MLEVAFKVNWKELQAAVNKIFAFNRAKKSTVLKITVESDCIVLAGQGITQRVKGETEGLGDVLMPEKVFSAYLGTVKLPVVSFRFRSGELECGSSLYCSSAIEVHASLEKGTEEAPINLNPISVLRFAAGKTQEEIKQLGLTNKLKYARDRMREKVNQAVEVLSEFGVTYDDVNALLKEKGF